jgi:hypothetical protein
VAAVAGDSVRSVTRAQTYERWRRRMGVLSAAPAMSLTSRKWTSSSLRNPAQKSV